MLAVGGCDWLDDLRDPPRERLTGRLWQLVGVRHPPTDSTIFAPGPRQDSLSYRYDVRFQGDGTLLAHSACNQCFGEYERGAEHALSVTGMGCTEAACDGGFNRYGEFLHHIEHYRLRSGRLLLYSTTRDGQRFVMRHRARPRHLSSWGDTLGMDTFEIILRKRTVPIH